MFKRKKRTGGPRIFKLECINCCNEIEPQDYLPTCECGNKFWKIKE